LNIIKPVIIALRGETNLAFGSGVKGVVFGAVSVVIQPRAIVEVDELVAGPKSASRTLPSDGTVPIVTVGASKSRPPAADEVAAADAVAAVRSGDLGVPITWVHADTGTRQKMHDFWLVGDGVREALEITTLMEQGVMTDLKHWQKVGPGHEIMIPGLARAWTIMVDPQANAKALTNGLAEWLQALERDQIVETGRWDGVRLGVHPVTTAMAITGVMMASSVTGPPPGLVMFRYATGIPSRPAGDPNHVSTAVTMALALPKHIKDAEKLDTSGVDVRHLFLWVDSLTRLDIRHALDDGVPTSDPVVDPRITEIWLGPPAGNDLEVLRWSEGDGWRYAEDTLPR
jgi:hypothetical protein